MQEPAAHEDVEQRGTATKDSTSSDDQLHQFAEDRLVERTLPGQAAEHQRITPV